ncbi:MAG: hypothetical protein Q7R72_02890 [bacterium]|nr:hypothetical protein [bacterium]
MSTIMFSDVRGVLNDLNEKLAGEKANETLEGLKKFLRGENPFETVTTTAKWEVREGVIYVTLPASEGITGPQWIKRLKKKDLRVSEYAEGLLKSKDFKPTTGVVHKLAILSGKTFSDSERITRTIRAEGKKRGWDELNPEAICILRENFSDKELEAMGFYWIVGIHEPIEVGGDPHFLVAARHDDGSWLGATWADPGYGWRGSSAFAWSLPQVST